LIARLKAQGYKVMATATTGIASLLLFGGRTMHSALRIPLNISWDTQPAVDYASTLAEMLRQVDVLIIDEISAGHKNVINYIDNLFRSVAEHEHKNIRFGGKVRNYIINSLSLLLMLRLISCLAIGNNFYQLSKEETFMLPTLPPLKPWTFSYATRSHCIV
jgi:hypothetical protein